MRARSLPRVCARVICGLYQIIWPRCLAPARSPIAVKRVSAVTQSVPLTIQIIRRSRLPNALAVMASPWRPGIPSFTVILIVFREFPVKPAAPVMAAPRLPDDKSASDRAAPWNDDRPKVPAVSPFRLAAFETPKMVGTVERHQRSVSLPNSAATKLAR